MPYIKSLPFGVVVDEPVALAPGDPCIRGVAVGGGNLGEVAEVVLSFGGILSITSGEAHMRAHSKVFWLIYHRLCLILIL